MLCISVFFEIRSSEVEKSPFLSRNRLILPAKIAFYGSKIALRQRESVFLSCFLDFYGFQRLIFVSDKGICQQNRDKMLCSEAIFIYPDGWRKGLYFLFSKLFRYHKLKNSRNAFGNKGWVWFCLVKVFRANGSYIL